MGFWDIMLTIGAPGAFFTLLFFFIKRHFHLEDQKRMKRQAEVDKKEEEKLKAQIAWQEENVRRNNEYNLIVISCLNATMDLGEANAQALIDKKANGEVHAAIAASKKARCEQLQYLQKEVVAGLRK